MRNQRRSPSATQSAEYSLPVGQRHVMVKLARALPALTVAALAACKDAPTVRPMSAARGSAKLAQTPAVQVFKVKFDAMNNSGVGAEATLQMRDGNLTVTLDGVGRIPNQI